MLDSVLDAFGPIVAIVSGFFFVGYAGQLIKSYLVERQEQWLAETRDRRNNPPTKTFEEMEAEQIEYFKTHKPNIVIFGSYSPYHQRLIELGRVQPPYPRDQVNKVESWVDDIVTISYSKFSGNLSAKRVLYPFVRDNAKLFETVPARWRTLHFLEDVVRLLREFGFAGLHKMDLGVRINHKGIEHFGLDPKDEPDYSEVITQDFPNVGNTDFQKFGLSENQNSQIAKLPTWAN